MVRHYQIVKKKDRMAVSGEEKEAAMTLWDETWLFEVDRVVQVGGLADAEDSS